MISATIFEAKTNLSALVKKAKQGETAIITSGREKTPVAKLEAAEPVPRRQLGSMRVPGYLPTNAIFEPLPKGWSGEDE